jgi:hypothetical protein
MAAPRFELPNGLQDGVNQTFYTSLPYLTASLQVFINGQLKRADLDDGYTLSPSLLFVMKQAPLPTDVFQVYYQPL